MSVFRVRSIAVAMFVVCGLLAGVTNARAKEPKPTGAAGNPTGRRPNVLLILADDLGYADVGFQGCKDIPTPHLDKLAAKGVRFTNGYVTGVVCSPTRAGLLTGRYQTRFGHEGNPGDRPDEGLSLKESTLADRLEAAGYRTGLVGKWHLGRSAELHPQKRGFDEFYGFLAGGHSYFDKAGILRGTEQVTEVDYATDAFGREAASFVERHKGQPWFLYLAFNAVHGPVSPTKERLAKFSKIEDDRRRGYAASMLALDDAIGVLLAKLNETGQAENTLIGFISDNGGPTLEGMATGARNDPLRGGKRTTLEGGVRVPFVVTWPSHVQPGIYEQPVIQLDLHATALAAAGVTERPEWKLEGVNLLPYLSGEKKTAPHDALYWRYGTQTSVKQMAIRSGDWKLVRYDLAADGQKDKGDSPARLYDLASDIHEDTDLSATNLEKVKELQAKWDEWNKANVRPYWEKVSPQSK